MKRLISLSLICMLVLPMPIGLSGNTTTAPPAESLKEITFRGLPADASMSDVKEMLFSEGIKEEAITVEATTRGYQLNCRSTEPIKLAGYSLYTFTVEFYYAVKDGAPDNSPEEAGLVSAKYEPNYDDQELVFNALNKKLSSLYGAPIENRTVKSYINASFRLYKDTLTWKGANDSYITLRRQFNSYDGETMAGNSQSEGLWVEYFLSNYNEKTKKIDEILEAMKEIEMQKAREAELQKIEEEIEEGTSDMTGL